MLLYPTAPQRGEIGPLPPGLRLQITPEADLQALRAREDARLSTYGWVDRSGQVARIPIDRAMALTAERGLPGWPGPRAPAAADTSETMRR